MSVYTYVFTYIWIYANAITVKRVKAKISSLESDVTFKYAKD